MPSVTVLAPAKINLFLHVGEKRADGFHELESLVVFAELGDRLEFAGAETLTLGTTGPFASKLARVDNLALRAARALDAKRGARIALEKNLPVAAGLGGGSADAAATLRGLNALWQLGRSEAELRDIGAALGADVPACVLSRPLWMEGKGERVREIAPLPPFSLVLANPGFTVSTAHVFAALNARTGMGAMPLPAAINSIWDLVDYLDDAGNDLEGPASSLVPAIDDVLEALAHEPGCVLAQMSGSGATCFGLFQNGPWSTGAAERLTKDHPDWWVRATRIAGPDIGAPR